MERIILHCDMNNFYASVECMLDPSLASLPLAVCGSESDRHGIVLAKNDLAKARGIKTAEPIWQARRRCPELVTVPPHYDEYLRLSRAARRIYERYTDLVEGFGLDECWLDCTGSSRLFGSPEEIAEEIRLAVRRELGLTISVGVSFNKVFAKLASDMKKPDAITVISEENFRETVWQLPVGDLLGVGGATAKRLSTLGIRTIGDLAVFPEPVLEQLIGKIGKDLRRHALGLDFTPVVSREEECPEQSIGHGVTLAEDLVGASEVETLMISLTEEIGHRLYLYDTRAEGIAISIRDSRLHVKEWQCKLSAPTQSARVLAREAFELFSRSYGWELPIRSVSVRATHLNTSEESSQICIFDESERLTRAEVLDTAVEKIRHRFGLGAIRAASLFSGAGKKMPRRRERCALPSGARF